MESTSKYIKYGGRTVFRNKKAKSQPTEYRVYFKLAESKRQFELDPQHLIERRFGFLSRRIDHTMTRVDFTNWLSQFLKGHGIEVPSHEFEVKTMWSSRHQPGRRLRSCVVHLPWGVEPPEQLTVKLHMPKLKGEAAERAVRLGLH